MLGKDEINKRFGANWLTPDGSPTNADLSAVVRQNFKWFAEALDKALPDGRAKSVSMTYLEDCFLWAKHSLNDISPVSETTSQLKLDFQTAEMQANEALSVGHAALVKELDQEPEAPVILTWDKPAENEDLPEKG